MEPEYVHGHHGSVVSNHAQRRASDSAAFLTDRLDARARLLDVGCGPGSITLDLARFVSSVVGIDASREAIQAARDMDEASVVTWRVADLHELPFRDGEFDVVFAHQVLQHLANPIVALREMRRVLRSGGMIALRDADYGTMVHSPHDARLDRWLELYRQVAIESGGQPHAGRFIAQWVAAAGFVDLEITTSTWTYSTASEVRAWRDLWVSRLLQARLGERALSTGRVDRTDLEDLAEGWREWARSPHPFFAFLHGEVIARAP